MIQQSESVTKLFAALVAAGGELRNPPKDSVNPHFKSRYADLATVLDTVRPVLAKHKLAVVQMPAEMDGGPGLATTLVHESGEWMRSFVRLYPGKTDPQGIGSALTYARRYGIQAALGIAADDDDDGHAGSKPAPPAKAAQQPAQQQPAKEDKAKKEKAPPPATLAELYATIGKAEPPADGKQLDSYMAGTAAHLLRLADYQPDELFDAVKQFLKAPAGTAISALNPKQVESGWNHVKQLVKRFADSASATAAK